MHETSRRHFLGNLGHGMLVLGLGPQVAAEVLGQRWRGHPGAPPLRQDLQALVRAMQEEAPDDLLGLLVAELRAGTTLRTLVAAGALANARTFGGEDYEGYHAQMSLLPALHMAGQVEGPLQPLPVLKVLYRNTARIQKAGGGREVLQPVEGAGGAAGEATAVALRERVRECDMQGAERLFAAACAASAEQAFEDLQASVQDDLNVHRIVLAWRAWDMLPLVGAGHAHTILRQCVRFCVDEERQRRRKGGAEPAVRRDVPRLLDQHRLLGREPGARTPDDAWLAAMADLVCRSDRARAADAAAAALAEGFAPDAVAEAIVLAGNQLLLHDTGKERVHGASVGVHASDAANAWRNLARTGSHANRVASLLVAAYHTAGQSHRVGELPYGYDEQLAELGDAGPKAALAALRRAVEARDQRGACAAAARYGRLDAPPGPVFAVLRGYATSEDGALHAEKYYHTVHEEFARARPALRWRHVVALARVTASEFGERAPGYERARRLLES